MFAAIPYANGWILDARFTTVVDLTTSTIINMLISTIESWVRKFGESPFCLVEIHRSNMRRSSNHVEIESIEPRPTPQTPLSAPPSAIKKLADGLGVLAGDHHPTSGCEFDWRAARHRAVLVLALV